MKRIYVAGPIQGANLLESLRNIDRGQREQAILIEEGFAPFPVFDDFGSIMKTRGMVGIEQVYAYSIAWLECSHAVLMLPGWETSKGALAEWGKAKELGIPVFDSIESLIDWRDCEETVAKIELPE